MIGKVIAHYKIIEKLGSGGMGVVYKAQDTKLDRFVALKFLPPHLGQDEENKKRFIYEAKAASALDHPNICNIFEIDETEDGQMFIAMACYEGESLRDKIGRGPLPIDEAIDIAIQITQGLEKAHSKEIVHRDIKPANVLITEDSQVKIVDFGLAKLAGRTMLTKEGTTLGTVAYMSPEQTQGTEVDHRTDIWALGAVLYEMVTGQMPFKGDYDQAVMYSIMHEDPAPITGLRTGVPMELERIVCKCLEKDPANRYQHADELIVDLRRIKEESKSGVRATVVTEGRRKMSHFIVPAILSLLVVMVIAGYVFFGREAASRERIPIAVVDFVNETKHEELNGLSGMLITALEQSRRLSVLTRSRMFDILKQMDKRDVSHIDETLGREICKRANVAAMVIASVRKFDQLYTIDLKVIDPIKDEHLFTAGKKAEGMASIPGMIDKLAAETRKHLKETEPEIQTASEKVAEVTTPNLEAYQHYFQGQQLINQLKFHKSQEEFKKAIDIDPKFTLAYYRLAYARNWWGEEGVAEPLQKAMQYIDTAPEKEKYLIRAFHERRSGKIDEATALYQELLELYPTEKEALWEIGDLSYHKADYRRAITYFEKLLATDPTFERALQHIIWSYKDMGQYDQMLEYAKQFVAKKSTEEAYSLLGQAFLLLADFDQALETWRRAREVFPNRSMPIIRLGWTYFFKNEYEKAETEFRKLVQESRPLIAKSFGLRHLALFYAYFGRYRDALKNLNRIIEIARETGYTAGVPLSYAEKAFWVMVGWKDDEKAHELIQEGLKYKEAANVFFYMYLLKTYLMMSEYENANSVVEDHLKPLLPHQDLVVNAYVHRTRGEYGKAIRGFLKVTQEATIYDQIYYSYDLAECYFETGQLVKAVKVLHRLQNVYNDSHYFRSAVYPRSFYLLGKIYERKGDRNLAMKNYERFLDFWKNADEDLLNLIEAKARLAKLKGTTAS